MSLSPGCVLDQRYEIVRVLGQGGFGCAYLAYDRHRFNEPCVLKQFTPQVRQPAVLQKAKELFEREANTLYRLRHPQIPAFRALLATQIQDEAELFLVEQYIEGETYQDWLDRGHRLSEAEALQLLQEVLPVLSYVHQQGVIHRDISPDNLMRDRHSHKPVLIDFGSVKQVAQTALQASGAAAARVTQIHKLGYTPPEQLRGAVSPRTDLYALGVTVLVLLTGRSPLELYDPQQQVWIWRHYIRLQPGFEQVLDRLVATTVGQAYLSADAALQAIQSLATASARDPVATQPPRHAPRSNVKTVAVAPAWQPTPLSAPLSPAVAAPAGLGQLDLPAVSPVVPQPWRRSQYRWVIRGVVWCLLLPIRLLWASLKLLWTTLGMVDRLFSWVVRLLLLAVVAGLATIVSLVGKPLSLPFLPTLPQLVSHLPSWESLRWQPPQLSLPPWPTLPPISVSLPDWNSFRMNHADRCSEIVPRHQQLGLTRQNFYAQVNREWYERHPELQGRLLSDGPEDAKLRQEWCDLADQILNRLESHSP
jgi:serine/threonine-protein kinase